jgi:PAS domain S-box-containing protein
LNEQDKKGLGVVAVAPSYIQGENKPVVVEFLLNDRYVREINQKQEFEMAYVLLSSDNKNKLGKTVVAATDDLWKKGVFDSLESQLLEFGKSKKKQLITRVNLMNKQYMMLAERVLVQDDLFALTFVSVEEGQETAIRIIIGTGVMLLLVGLWVFAIYSLVISRITYSIEKMIITAERVADGDFKHRIQISTGDEIEVLAGIFNRMLNNLKEVTSDMKDEKERLEVLISSIPEGIIMTDKDNRLIMANRKAEQMFQFSSNRLHGKYLLEYINNEDLASMIKEELKSGKKFMQREICIPQRSKKDKYYVMMSSLVKNQIGSHLGVITVLRDITHEKELKELRDGFLRTVSHELRTPLTTIIGFMELLYNQKNEEQRKNYLNIMMQESKELKTMIDDLLDLSRMDAGRMEMTFEEINICDLLDSLKAAFEPLASNKKLDIKVKFKEEYILVNADPSKLRRIMVNLISNAIKFTEKGSITLSAKVAKECVEISVKDTGIGLMDDEKEFIFEKFRQVDYSQRRKYEGIGLGLSIVKKLVEMHNGDVGVKSEYGKGSVFTFILPV